MPSLYAGPLTQYFHTALVQSAAPDPAPPLAAVRERVLAWRTWIGEGLQRDGHLTQPLTWDEPDEAPWLRGATSTPAVQALKLFAVHRGADQDAPDSPLPERLPAEPERDPVWSAAAAAGFTDHRYAQLLVPELWLPARFAFTFRCPYPDGHEVFAGSLHELVDELEALGRSEFAGADELADAWVAEPAPEPGAPVFAAARHAFAVLRQTARAAVDRDVPMLWHA